LFAGLLAAVPLPAAHILAPQHVEVPGWVHFVGVGQTALLATAAAIVLTAIGIRRQDSRAVLVGTAFTAMAALLALHGFATPGILVGYNGVVSLSGGALIVLAIGLGFYGILGLRALHTFLLTRRWADLLVVVGLAWLAGALVGALVMGFTQLGWWVGHGLELAGIACVGGAVALDLHRGVQSRALIGDLRGSELVSEAGAFLGSQIRALTVRLAEKDTYTEEQAGSAFDSRCVEALARVLAREPASPLREAV
jgi:hypothetical protein